MQLIPHSNRFNPVSWILRLAIVLAFFTFTQYDQGGFLPLLAFFTYFFLDLIIAITRPFENFGYLIFLMMFSFFLSNSLFLNLFNAEGGGLEEFDTPTRSHVLICFIISLLAVDIGYSLRFGKNPRAELDNFQREKVQLRWKSIGRISWLIFCISGLLFTFSQVHKTIHVLNNGYLAYYTSYSAPIPFIFGFAATTFSFSFMLYLTSRPSKRDVWKASAIYLIVQFLSFGYGQRNPGMIAVLIILFYLSIREIESGRSGKWFSKKLTLSLILSLPFVLSFLYIFSFQRVDRTYETTSIADAAVGLLEQQSGSARVVALGFEYKDVLREYGSYLFTPLMDIFTKSPFFRFAFADPEAMGRTAESAINSGVFGQALTYAVSPATYAAGGGLGSSYIAELYQDFGYSGVFLGSVIFGVILSLSRIVFGRKILLLVILMALPAIWYAPRASYFSFLYDLLNSSVLIIAAIVILHVNIAQRGNRIKVLNKEKNSRLLDTSKSINSGPPINTF